MNPNELFGLLPDMAVFARVVDAGNFSVAARQLGSTPSTVSRQIKRLEEALATRLLERSTRKVRVTESGAQVARYCREMVSAASGAVDAAGQLTGRPQGKVSVSAPTQFARTVIHPLVPDFLRAYPEVDLQLLYSDHAADPLDDNLDLVIRLTERPPAGLAGRRLGSVRWVRRRPILTHVARRKSRASSLSTIASILAKRRTTTAGVCGAARTRRPSKCVGAISPIMPARDSKRRSRVSVSRTCRNSRRRARLRTANWSRYCPTGRSKDRLMLARCGCCIRRTVFCH
jgi:DNA-binding transcriptional LysR family regulator